ncbi:hypothetical protein ABZ805_08875 [Saccharopolyspora sp. NPDC047091]|uniref:hypothetical protein n=1 Tax=Saccharopolyspora sp. NPDC047091 TaxID=3155924 RepID=UPI00340B9651
MNQTKRKHRVAPPAGPDKWEVRCGNNDAGKGWDQLCQAEPANTRWAWEQMSSEPAPSPPTTRHHRMKGSLSTRTFEGRTLPQWQLEVTGAARVWYLLDEERSTVWIVHAGPSHPKSTE